METHVHYTVFWTVQLTPTTVLVVMGAMSTSRMEVIPIQLQYIPISSNLARSSYTQEADITIISRVALYQPPS